MSLVALCLRRSSALLITAASDDARLQWGNPHSQAHCFIESVSTNKPRFALITQDYLNDPSLFTCIRTASPQTRIVICLTANALMPTCLWTLLDELDFDVVCTLPELTACLQTLVSGRFYKSSLLQHTAASNYSLALPGLADLTPAERRILQAVGQHKTGPQIAEALFISEKTVNNHKYNIAQKLQVTGGPGSLTRYVNTHREQLRSSLI